MKSIKILKHVTLCTLFLTVFGIISLFAQPDLASSSKGEGNGGHTSHCKFIGEITVPLTNLDFFLPTSTIDPNTNSVIEYLPSGYPEMFIEISTYQGTTTLPLLEFYDIKKKTPAGKNVFEALIIQEFEFCDLCKGKGTSMDVPVTLRLVGRSGGDYQACNYTDINDIFSCDYFNNPTCNSSNACINKNLIEKTHIIKVSCGSGSGIIRSRLSTELTVSPNPFTNEIIISIPSDIELGTLNILDVNGKTVKSLEKVSGTSKQSINTSNLGSGVYIVTIENEGKRYNTKVIKL